MRCAGRIDPGSGAAVCTGQAVFFMPAFTAITSAMLSFLVRPLMVGTAIGGALATGSPPGPEGVLDAFLAPPPTGVAAAGVLEVAIPPAAAAVDGATRPSMDT